MGGFLLRRDEGYGGRKIKKSGNDFPEVEQKCPGPGVG